MGEPNFLQKMVGSLVHVGMMDYTYHEGILRSYNRYEILIEIDSGAPVIVMKHAIVSMFPIDGNPFKEKNNVETRA